ncbi:extracellular solute-binding protein [Glaciecola petra]|uniref:Extracellular solute-binding protein n=1 Tax=Glaciecola petra TaxID=3075602 RepID=A0ABU2ZQ10_9ALTE|nr:extracellular solute-binding protein [Aestuariibacter sp. P117]MDT0594685.1 extracellular solute-binding protein [Aestuariibacter sp. P117]
MYSGRQEALIKPLLDKFTEETGITVNLVTGKGDALISRLKAEGQFSPADMIVMADVGRLVRAEQMGLTQAISEQTVLSKLDAKWQDKQGKWIALTKRARPIMVKKGTFEDNSLVSLMQLTDEKYRNSVCIRSSSNIYNQSMMSGLIALWGEEKALAWAKGLVANFARSPKGGDRDQIKAMVAGECSIAIANTYYLGGMLAAKDKTTREVAQQVKVIWHDQTNLTGSEPGMGTHVNVSGAAITAHAKNKANAETLLAYMLTDEAQQWYAQINHEYPVIDGVALSPELASFGEFKGQDLDLKTIGKNNANALILMDRAGWK